MLDKCCIEVMCVGYGDYIVLMLENIQVLKRCRLEYLRVKCFDACNLLSNGARKEVCVYRGRERVSEYGKMLTLVNLSKRHPEGVCSQY